MFLVFANLSRVRVEASDENGQCLLEVAQSHLRRLEQPAEETQRFGTNFQNASAGHIH